MGSAIEEEQRELGVMGRVIDIERRDKWLELQPWLRAGVRV